MKCQGSRTPSATSSDDRADLAATTKEPHYEHTHEFSDLPAILCGLRHGGARGRGRALRDAPARAAAAGRRRCDSGSVRHTRLPLRGGGPAHLPQHTHDAEGRCACPARLDGDARALSHGAHRGLAAADRRRRGPVGTLRRPHRRGDRLPRPHAVHDARRDQGCDRLLPGSGIHRRTAGGARDCGRVERPVARHRGGVHVLRRDRPGRAGRLRRPSRC